MRSSRCSRAPEALPLRAVGERCRECQQSLARALIVGCTRPCVEGCSSRLCMPTACVDKDE
eukprot:scaffold121408_cov30-Tisochrysis_lutea.AAC.3